LGEIAEFVLAWPAYWTARIVLPIITIGRVAAATRDENYSAIDAIGMGRRADGTILLGFDCAALVGLLIWALLIVVGVLLSCL